MEKEILLLIDYRSQFYFSTKYRGASVDLDLLKEFLNVNGYELKIMHFFDLDFRKEDYKNKWILYQSSEDPGLLYKDFLEDNLLTLDLLGAKLIPKFPFFRGHHNKVFMEFLRDTSPIPELKNISSKAFGTFEEYTKCFAKFKDLTYVLKPSSGTKGAGIKIVAKKSDKYIFPYTISLSFTFKNLIWFFSKKITGKPYTAISNNRKKFLFQSFIGGLGGDYRILVYGDKYYVVYRKAKRSDFRGSGSGKLSFVEELPHGLLDFQKKYISG